jgi:hypothetical protein
MYINNDKAAVARRMKPVLLVVASSKIIVLTLLSASLLGVVDFGVKKRTGVIVHTEIAEAR